MLGRFYKVSHARDETLGTEVFLFTLMENADPKEMMMTGVLDGDEKYLRYIRYLNSKTNEWRLEVYTQHNPVFVSVAYYENGSALISKMQNRILEDEVLKIVKLYEEVYVDE